jgi:hypothetical protein
VSGNLDLTLFKKNVYSQHGEDGIITEILSRISQFSNLDRWCVEFGAWDGVHLSNTAKLIRELDYSAVLIEGDSKRTRNLNLNFPQENVYKINKFITFDGNDTLEKVLASTPIPVDFDFLSIDVDGVDYHIFNSIETIKPKIICIEFNPTIPNSVDFVQPKDFLVKQGSSAKALIRLGVEKNYSLATVVGCNLIFVRSDLIKFVVTDDQILEKLYPAGNNGQYIFTGYDGSILSNQKSIFLNWHGIEVPLEKLQFLPKFLRIFEGDYGASRKFFVRLFLATKFPKRSIMKILRRFLISNRNQ